MKKAQPPQGPIEPNVELVESPNGEPVKVENVKKPVTFFSRFKDDELLMETSQRLQDGPNKWITVPAKVIKFRDRAFVTNDPEKIAYLRNHPEYGRKLFEFGVEGHDKRIATLDDAGRIAELEKFSRLGRFVETRYRRGLE